MWTWSKRGGKAAVVYTITILLLLVITQWPVGGYSPHDDLPSTSPEQNETMDTDPPAAPVLASAILAGTSNENVLITWSLSADDGAGGDDVSHYAVYCAETYDYDGDGYSYLGQAGSGETAFTHALAGDGDWLSYFYYVQANDTSGNGNWSGQAGKFVRFLEKGKHLASIPLVQEATTLEVVLQTLAGSFKHVRYYKSSDQSDHWKTYWTFKTYGTLFDIDHRMGFWIDMTKDDHLVVAGLVPEMTQIELGHNWNLVGYPSFIDRTVSDALAGIDWRKVQGWGATPPYHQKQMSSNDIIRAGEGYWVWVDLPQVWEVSNMPPPGPYIVWTDPAGGQTDVPLNASIVVKFSTVMDASTVTFTLVPARSCVLVWSEGDTRLEIVFMDPWFENITVTIEVFGLDINMNPLVPGPVPNPWSFSTGLGSPPYIVMTDPYDGEDMVDLWKNITIQFSREMVPGTFHWNFTLGADPGGWSETWTQTVEPNDTVTLGHSNPFLEFSTYCVIVDHARDIFGRDLLQPHCFEFSTGGVGVYILMTSPYQGAVDVPLTECIIIVFSEPMNTTSVNFMISPTTQVVTTWLSNTTLQICPASVWMECTVYTIQVLSGYSLSGKPLIPAPVPNPWQFTTLCSQCCFIVQTDPFHAETFVTLDRPVVIVFNDVVDPSTFMYNSTPDPGGWVLAWSNGDTVVTLTHNDFQPYTQYTLHVSYVEGVCGQPLQPGPVPNPWSFTTISVGTYIVQTDPYDGQLGAPLNHSLIVWFSQPMSYVNWSVFPFIGFQPFWLNNTTLELYHPIPFNACTEYDVNISGLDLNGLPLVPGPVPNPFSFTTECGNPYIVLTDPYDGETNVDPDRNITIWFSEPMNTSTVMWAITPDPGGWAYAWSTNDTVLFLTHANPLSECVRYIVAVTYGEDKDGNPLVPGPVPNPWNFTTGGYPYILWTDPTNGEVNVPLTASIHIEFSWAMDHSSFNWTISPDPGGWSVNWVSNSTVVLNHSNPFDPSTIYVFTILYIEDIHGTPLLGLPAEITFST